VNGKEKRRESGWIGLKELADALGLSLDHVRKNVLRHVPADCQRRDGQKIMVYGRAAIEAWLGERVPPKEKCPQCQKKDDVIDFLLDPEKATKLLE